MLKMPISVLLFLLLVADLESASVQQKDVPVTRVHLVFMNHLGGYPDNPGPVPIHPGGLSWNDCATFPGFNHALCFAFRTDNSGPPKSVQEILSNFEVARGQFPDAYVKASTLESFIEAVQPIKSKLPVITQESGDTWINGIASDPRKVAEFRTIMRLRKKCIESGNCSLSDDRFYNSSRFLVKPAEHTWGLWAPNDNIHWTNAQFHKYMNSTGFVRCVRAWQEQRNFSYLAIDALQNHSLAWDLRHELSKLYALKPDLSDGAISKLIDPLFNTSWASKTNVLGKFVYQTFDDGDFNYFDRHYAWTASFLGAVGKPNMSKNASPVSQLWETSLLNLYRSKEIDVSLQWFGKTTTRLPESLNFVFNPTQNTDGAHWMIHKLGQWIDPLNVVLNGSQRLHVMDRGVYYINSKSQGMEIVSYDAGLVNVLTPDWDVNALSLPLKPIMSVDGMAFNLYNNLWDTNYIYWYPFEQRDINQKFRFTLNFKSPKSKFHKVYQQKSQALKFVSSLKDTFWKFSG
ncbi:hypothetical protein KUTeg_011158 [Tegillarca granosa]|uniref:Uncharacterized protein n=1 Tax=Tegillarca granosa TaxID=220873 RepID=A0ABQ9F513_TEGGR|nr:hypothetical protein KUTeg_011158 [Tegillarca granosa]